MQSSSPNDYEGSKGEAVEPRVYGVQFGMKIKGLLKPLSTQHMFFQPHLPMLHSRDRKNLNPYSRL